MANPLVAQGTLNLLRASVVLNDHPELNVTASCLGKEGITISLEGETTEYIDTLAGAVPSPQPYQKASVRINLLKTQPLSDAYKKQMELLALIGDITVRPDSSALSPYPVVNCSITGVEPLKLNGSDAGFVVTVRGYYNINSALWNG